METEGCGTKLLMSMLQQCQGHERQGKCQVKTVGFKMWPLNRKGYMETDSRQEDGEISIKSAFFFMVLYQY